MLGCLHHIHPSTVRKVIFNSRHMSYMCKDVHSQGTFSILTRDVLPHSMKKLGIHVRLHFGTICILVFREERIDYCQLDPGVL